MADESEDPIQKEVQKEVEEVEKITQSPFAEYTAKESNKFQLTINEFINFLNLVKQLDPNLSNKPLNYIFDGEYQSGFAKVVYEDGQIWLVDNG